MPELVHDPQEVERPRELGDSTVVGGDSSFEAVTFRGHELE